MTCETKLLQKKRRAISVAGEYSSIKIVESEADKNKQNIICVEESLYKAEKYRESFRMEKSSPISLKKSILHLFSC